MTLQDRLAKNAGRVLEPGERVQAVIAVQTFHPAMQLLGFLWVFVSGGRYHLVVATDRRIALLKTKLTSYRHPVGVLASFPRDMALGPVGGPPASITLGGKVLYVIAGTKKSVAAADQLRPASPVTAPTIPAVQSSTPFGGIDPNHAPQPVAATPPANWYPDPSGTAAFRYWDGHQWTPHTHSPTAGGS